MTTATVRITTSTREQLRELAEQTGKSMQVLMAEAVTAYHRRRPGASLEGSAELYTELCSEAQTSGVKSRPRERFRLVTFGQGGRFSPHDIDKTSALLEIEDVERFGP